MKGVLTAALLLGVMIVVAVWLALSGKAPPVAPVARSASPDAVVPGLDARARATNVAPAPSMVAAPVADGAGSGNARAPARTATPMAPPEAVPPPAEEQVIEAVRLVIRTYGQRFRGNPVGNNAEITAALNGGNARGVRFLEGLEDRINARGELVDEWGTAYFFHQLSGAEMEIRSAGPDRAMWTTDDLVVR